MFIVKEKVIDFKTAAKRLKAQRGVFGSRGIEQNRTRKKVAGNSKYASKNEELAEAYSKYRTPHRAVKLKMD